MGIPHVARIRRIRCHIGLPPPWISSPPPWISSPPPPDKIPYGKSSHLWDYFPPSQQKSHMLSQYYIWNLCWRRFAIEGEGLPYSITPPWGSSAVVFVPLSRNGCVGGIYHRGGSFIIIMVLFLPWGGTAM